MVDYDLEDDDDDHYDGPEYADILEMQNDGFLSVEGDTDIDMVIFRMGETEDRFEDLGLYMAGRDDHMEVDSTPEADGLQRMKPIVVDSGAEESVMDPEDAPGYAVTESAGSRRGAKYVGPGGERIPNRGQQRIQLMLKGGRRSNLTFN